MKYLILSALLTVSSVAFGEEAVKKTELPQTVLAAADTRIEIIIKWKGETYRVLVPAEGSSLNALKAVLRKEEVSTTDRKTNEKAVADGGKHAVLNLLGGNYVLVPQK